MSRNTLIGGKYSVQENPTVDINKELLSPFRTKFGLMKNFVKARDKNGTDFQHLNTILRSEFYILSSRTSSSSVYSCNFFKHHSVFSFQYYSGS